MPIAISQKMKSIHQKKEESNICILLNSGEVHCSHPATHAAGKHRTESVGDAWRRLYLNRRFRMPTAPRLAAPRTTWLPRSQMNHCRRPITRMSRTMIHPKELLSDVSANRNMTYSLKKGE